MLKFPKAVDSSGKPIGLSILVPLDGSTMAESVLAGVVMLATKFQAKVLLLHAIEKNPPATIHGEKHLSNVAEAQSYLEKIAAQLKSNNITVEIHVHEAEQGNIASSILEHAGELDPDLVVMCAHGSGGIKGMIFGPIAHQVLQKGIWPILLMPPVSEDKNKQLHLERILVPLDGTPEHEMSLAAAVPLARAFNAHLHLLWVIPTLRTISGEQGLPARLMPGAMRAVLDMAEAGGKEYLEGLLAKCRAENFSVSAEIKRGDAVPEVLDLADKLNADLIVMASHGRVGIDALLKGSVAPRIAGKIGRPLLLIRATKDISASGD
jgi:nucleotide-binding universal stress UspA family protein